MDAVGIERGESRGAAAELQYPVALQCPAGTVHVREAEEQRLGCEGRWERRSRGFAHGRQERRFFF
jgi:hypothetical protein